MVKCREYSTGAGMKPVYQTKFGDEGNCLRASVASLLELKLEDVPEWGDYVGWYADFCAFFRQHGLQPFRLKASEIVPHDTYYLIWGISPRGIDHSVIGLNGTMVHDPHPDQSGIETIEEKIVFLGVIKP